MASLQLAIGLAFLGICLAVPGGLDWTPFSKSHKASINTDFSDEAVERFYVRYPCKDSIWFKLFLFRNGGQNGHIELYSKTKGNIYCNGAGRRNWYRGEKTDFTMPAGGMKCESDGEYLIIEVEKSTDKVMIKNQGRVLFTKVFSKSDADNCRKATTKVSTQVWNYGGNLDLIAFDNSAPLKAYKKWVPFTQSKQAVVTTDFSHEGAERFFVTYPCKDSVWFKLFLFRNGGQNAHIELYSKTKGNIYCNGAGRRNWYSGEKTDFTMPAGGMKCESDGRLIIEVVKTADRVTIKNQGRTLYNQAFSSSDANNCRQATKVVKTQVWKYGGVLGLDAFDNSEPLQMHWRPFSVSSRASVSTDFSGHLMERFLVRYPCKDSIWFKLFLNRAGGQNSHVELFSKTKGNIYCNGAGSKSWWGGEKTDFTMAAGGMKCESDGENLIIEVEKTASGVTILNRGNVLYHKSFSLNDGNCRQATTKVTTQVWKHSGNLDLAVLDNSA